MALRWSALFWLARGLSAAGCSHDSFDVHLGAYTPGSCATHSKPGQVNFGDPVTICCQSSN